VKVGDLVRTDDSSGPIGIILELTKRLYIPAATILVDGKVVEFDIEDLWVFYGSR